MPKPLASVCPLSSLLLLHPGPGTLPLPLAAIIATQLTTPYIRIAPAAGDNQLTGQTLRPSLPPRPMLHSPSAMSLCLGEVTSFGWRCRALCDLL